MISHQNVIAQCLQIRQITPDSHKKILAVLPVFHITGLVHTLHLPILINAEVYMLPYFTMESMLSTVSKYRIKGPLLVPPILIRLVHDPIVSDYDLTCVERFSFPGTGFKQGYGMTESCSCITAHPPEKYDYKYTHRVGTICASTLIKIVDEDGKELGTGQAGEILAKGPQTALGYLGNEKATRETFDEEGYLYTGDQAVFDDEGMVTITDRIKEMIKVKGIGVAPAELEDLLLGHDNVGDCAVLGTADEYSGEKPKAYIVRKNGVKSSEEKVGRQILSYVREKKVRYKWLEEVEFIAEIPKSASGKILRRLLRDRERGGQDRGVVVRDEAKAKL
ncbi:hypothetical protein ONS95_000932 [Cadophora gregata]|nr:uncharacterized protein ONS95_000932 [Cadophora gregata]KAK0102873.1 hypothetical protein ONS96_005501 [Cadophora gregata f. sp. sojae]KAK0128991.1 hypothetical protein ONS95_000932 [Cadophora gregata]